MAAPQRRHNLFAGRGAAEAGRAGEARAEQFLRARGLAVVARNWRDPGDRRREIDLICREGEVLVFVEVKARARGSRVPGYFAVGRAKRRTLARAAASFLRLLARRPVTYRLDVVEVEGEGRAARLRHFRNVGFCSKDGPGWATVRHG